MVAELNFDNIADGYFVPSFGRLVDLILTRHAVADSFCHVCGLDDAGIFKALSFSSILPLKKSSYANLILLLTDSLSALPAPGIRHFGSGNLNNFFGVFEVSVRTLTCASFKIQVTNCTFSPLNPLLRWCLRNRLMHVFCDAFLDRVAFSAMLAIS